MSKNIRKIIKRAINEDQPFGNKPDSKTIRTSGSVTGDDVADSLARSSVAIGKIKDNLRSMGVSTSDLDDVYTLEQLSAMAFKMKFTLLGGEFNKWDQNQVLFNFNGRAKVKETKPTLIIELDNGWFIKFSYDDLETNLPGTSKGMVGLKNGKKYKVMLAGSFDEGELTPNKGGDTKTNDSTDDTEDVDDEVKIPKEVLSGKNRNEIFRQLLNIYGGLGGKPVYGDGFLNPDDSKKLRKIEKEFGKKSQEVKKFKDSKRNGYSKMIMNLRKGYPKSFMVKLDKAFPEFGLQYTKDEMNESYLFEDTNKDKYKRWSIVFPNVGNDVVDKLDKNIVKFMKAVKAYFAVPITYRGKKHSYKINYDEKKVGEYYNNFYGKSKNESLINRITKLILEDEGDKPKKEQYVLLLDDIETGDGYSDNKNSGGKNNKKKGDKSKSKGGSFKVTNPNDNSVWVSGNVAKNVDTQFKKGVFVRKSEKHKDTIVVSWSKPLNDGTEAVLLSLPNIWDLFNGNKLNGSKVKAGAKISGEQEIKDKTEAVITLPKI